ncbi:MAG: epoxide hydrolase family protein [Microthrixaceae bacterium]
MSDTDEIQDFTIHHPEEQLEDLRSRLRQVRWPEQEVVADTDEPWSQGIPLRYTMDLARYWADEYDWRAVEAELNSLPNHRTVIDDVAIHFIHVRSPHDDALPVVMTHGWPGSVVEFLDVIEPLTNPTAHGGGASDAFHLVIPSLPGYGWSDKPDRAGWGVPRIAAAWEQLMLRLGYDNFGAQGGDWGSMVTTRIGMHHTKNLVGIHTNMAIVPPDGDTMDSLTEDEISALAGLDHYMKSDNGYSSQQSTRPQTVGYGLADSAVGQMAWIAEKFWAWTDHDGDPRNAISAKRQLDDIMTYWLTNSAASSARLYWESFADVDLSPVECPSAISVFPKEIFRTSQRWAEKRFTDLRYFNTVERGGHFAAFEQPELFVDEVRKGFRPMR